MFNIGPFELIVIFIVALIAIGPKRLPELARALGRAIGEFKRATNDLRASLDDIDMNATDEGAASKKNCSTKSSTKKNEEENNKDDHRRENRDDR